MGKSAPARKRQNVVIHLVSAVGLLLVGIALALVLWRHDEGGAAPQAEEWSVQPAAVNYPAPQLSLVNIRGETRALNDYQRNVVLVNNWAIWCPPCKAEMPTLVSYYSDHVSQGLMVIAIEAGEGKADVLPFVESFGMTFEVWLDPHNAAMAAFRNSNLPSSYVIDRASTVRYAWTGAISRPMLEQYVTPLLTADN